jgi:hypothetical protein
MAYGSELEYAADSDPGHAGGAYLMASEKTQAELHIAEC